MELTLENLNKAAVNNGLILGALQIALGIVTFYVAPGLFGSMWFGIANVVFMLILYIFFTIDLRKKIGGYWNFRQALKGIFLMAFVAGILGMVFNFLFYKFIEPDGFQKIAGFIEQGTAATFEKMGMDPDQVDEQVARQVETMRAQFDPTLTDFMKNLGIAILIQFVMSLIFAAIFKKEAPIFAPVDEE